MFKDKKIVFLGAGSMAEAMIAGMSASGIVKPAQITVSNNSNTERLKQLQRKYGIHGVPKEELCYENMDVVILAMKPKDAENALISLNHHLRPHQLVLSVLAGISTSFMEDLLPYGQQVVRVMPNTSSMIGESATAISPGKHTSQQNLSIAQRLLQCIGEVFIINESQMDIFTGIAGSGPAYFYYLMEHMEKAGQSGGLDQETTRQIIAQTILGAARMIQEQEESPEVLREKVTSPNGTTAAGLEALSKNGGGKAISRAVKQAAQRSKEISAQLETKKLKVI
ncbi:pyrroline-5-carboxylate reductase [Mesobacillus campisalis]|uniref:Pyrroline-5-carboxylate reductase n=1 Tax=Mesobacillus campisalis TaxID=1408103 RepID=A0A0M2SZ77_9BACI|nr:pyrroline-5-carboxylate reductase [Mesobacillus campisalis]KKK37905.1 pyrroline-5-carboxylate reductase [Mesobacillus campisalis]